MGPDREARRYLCRPGTKELIKIRNRTSGSHGGKIADPPWGIKAKSQGGMDPPSLRLPDELLSDIDDQTASLPRGRPEGVVVNA